MNARRIVRRLLAIGVGTALGLVALELVLQTIALVVWSTGERAAPGTRGSAGHAVLCIGDSFTYGLGADGPEGAYPMQLEARLRAGGQDVRVINGAWPGQDSATVLKKLPAQLAAFTPRRVCVLVGINDAWSLPARVAESELREPTSDGFPLRWRTARLFALARQWLSGAGAAPAAPPWLGDWHQEQVLVRFAADGRLIVGHDELRWSAPAGSLHVRLPDQREVPVEWRRDGARLELRSTLWPAPLTLEPGPPPAAAALTVDELRARHAAGDIAAGGSLAQRFAEDGDVAGALALAREVLRQHPGPGPAWDVLLQHGAADPLAAAVIREALARLAADDPHRATVLRMQATLLLDGEPLAALRSTLAAVLIDGDEAHAIQVLAALRGRLPADACARTSAELTADARQRARLSALCERAASGPAQLTAVLEEHLRRIVALCRAAGAEPLLVSYPEPQPHVDAALAAVAADTGAERVDLRPRFAELLRDLPRDALFIHDGHCTSRGYAEIAAAVAARLAQ